MSDLLGLRIVRPSPGQFALADELRLLALFDCGVDCWVVVWPRGDFLLFGLHFANRSGDAQDEAALVFVFGEFLENGGEDEQEIKIQMNPKTPTLIFV